MAQQRQNPQAGQGGQMNKSPSQTSTLSNQSNSSNASQNNPNLFNMFGTSLPSNPPPQNIAQQPTMVKQQAPVIPVTTATKQPDNNSFDFWANPTKTNPTQPVQPPKVVTPTQPVVQPISPVLSRPTQQVPAPIQPIPQTQQAQQAPGQNKTPTDGKGRSTTFNQLFGLGPK